MKRFTFRLQAVTMLRRLQEQERREALGAAVTAQRRREADLTTARTVADTLHARLLADRTAPSSGAALASAAEALRVEEGHVATAATALASASASVATCHARWVEARRGVQIIERLEERARQRHWREQERAEQTLLDDLAGQRAAASRTLSP